MEIVETARKHGVADADMLHAVAQVMFVHFFDDYRMIVGPGRNGLLLEVAINSRGQIFHAMNARQKFLRRWLVTRTDEEILAEIESDEGPEPTATVSGELAQVAVAMMQVAAAEQALDAAVASAREAGNSWQAIGEVLGMTRQGALKRFRAA